MNININIRFGLRAVFSATVIASFTLSSQMAFAYDPVDLQKLLTNNACNQCDLTNAPLAAKQLKNSSLMETDLSGADLSGALLRGANLSDANLTGATLPGTFLNGASLTGANLNNADLSGANLNNIRGDAASFTGANLSNTDLTSAILSCTNAAQSSTCVKLTDVQGQSVILNDAILLGADLSRADFSQGAMRNANLESATLLGTILCDTDLSKAIMPNRTIYSGDVAQFGADASCQPVIKSASAGSGGTIDYCSAGESIFPNSDGIQLGITPTVWSNSDDLSIDLVPPIPYQQIMSEIALSGFKGTQNSPKFPKDNDRLLSELNLRGITISEPWVGTFYTLGASGAKESQKIFDDQLAFMKTMGGDIIVVAEMGEAVHQQPIAPIANRPKFTEKQWEELLNGLNNIGEQAHQAGMKLVYHHHIGTGVESMDDIDRLMKGTKSEYVHLLLDTGHAYYAGIDPLALAKKYEKRIAHVHLKNIRQEILDQSIVEGMSFLDSVRAGIFTVPGDKAGAIDFASILETLASVNYQGWLIVEAEQDPNKANPLEYALMARHYLCSFAGL